MNIAIKTLLFLSLVSTTFATESLKQPKHTITQNSLFRPTEYKQKKIQSYENPIINSESENKPEKKEEKYEKPNPIYANSFLGVLVLFYLIAYLVYQFKIWPKEKEFLEKMNERIKESLV